MKKTIILLIFVLAITGCNETKKEISIKEPEEIIEELVEEPVEKYVDENKMLIGLYLEKSGKLELITEYQTNIKKKNDIGIFLIYPSNDESIKLNKGFGRSFYDEWISNLNYKNIKIGFNIKYNIDDTIISYNILDPNAAINSQNKQILSYLYDDYYNRNKSWYSHLKQEEYNSDSLFTSIKLFASNVYNVTSKIKLTVFTYDTLDDFDENNEYRGNSSYSITICDIDKTCG